MRVLQNICLLVGTIDVREMVEIVGNLYEVEGVSKVSKVGMRWSRDRPIPGISRYTDTDTDTDTWYQYRYRYKYR